jgi:PAS domain S-box-containing protein
LALLNRVSNALTQSLDLENIFDVTLREATEVLGADRAIALLIDSQQGRARLAFEFPRGDRPPVEDFPLESQTQIDELRRTLMPVVIQDVLNDPRTASNRETLKQHNVVSMVILPLTIGGQLMGTLAFETIGKRREFTPEQVEIAQAISSQAAITVQSANLFEQSLIRTRELELLFEATQSTSITLVLDEVYSNTVMQMMYAMQADGCALLYWDNVENTLIVARDINEQEGTAPTDAPGTVYNLPDYPTHDRALRARQVILMRADDPNLNQSERQLLETRKVNSRVIVPMVVREQSIGVLEVENRNPQRIFTASEVRLARTLASQSAVAIDNAKLQTETASKLEELFVINELSTSLAASIEQEQIIENIRARLPSLIKAQMWLMALLEEDKQTVSYPIALRENKSIQIASHPLGDDEISFLFKRRSAQRLAGTELDDVLRNLNIKLRITNSRSFLGVPMISSNEVVGALVLSDEKNPRAFGFDEERILSTVGAQIGVAIQNARLFAQTRRFTAELEQAVRQRTEELQHERDRIDFLYRITTGLAASLDIEIELDRALAMMAQAVGASMGAILGIDQISDNLIYRATHNLPTSETERMPTFSQREGLAGWVIQSQQSVVVDDAQTDPRWLKISAFDEQPRSVISALLEANEDILGVVMLYSDKPGLFTDDHLRLVTASAKQIASAMNNAELYSLIREQAERLAAMVRREQVDSTKNLAIVESIADGVMVADQNGDVTQFNSAAERILGLQRKQVIGSHITSLAGLYASAGGRRWLDAINRWIADPTEHRPGEELQVQLELDNNRYVSVVLSPVNMGDQFLGTVSVFRDITREVEVDRMKSEFVATVSHELRTPMTSIKGYADLLLLGAAGQVTDQQQKFLSTIKANADRLAELVNKLLDISRLDRGAVKLNMQSTDVEEVIDVSVRHLRSRVENERKNIDVTVNLPPDLPFIRADFDKITQVLNNLVDNAFNYTYPGGSINISAQADERSVVISVSDTGIGIPKDKQDLIWNRFFRDEEQHLVMETSGAGLGLSIVKEYVSMHDGEIWLESEVGKGTTFHVRIPTMAVTV